MINIKTRLLRLSKLAKGPELIWPDVSDVAAQAVKRIEELEAETERLAAVVRFHVRNLMKDKDLLKSIPPKMWKADRVKESKRKPVEETAVARAARYLNDGLDCDLIAIRMNINVSTVYGYLSKARHRGLIDRTTKIPMGKKPE